MGRYRAQHRCHVLGSLKLSTVRSCLGRARFGEVLWITRRQSLLESDPCEAGVEQSEQTTCITRLSELDERYVTSSQVQDEVHVLQRKLKNSEEHGVTVAYILNELCADKQHYTVIVAPEHRGFIHPLAR